MTTGALAALIDSALSQLPTAALPKRIVLGYSGGLDSEVLACALGQFKRAQNSGAIECLLVHVHHGLSANADAWAVHCRERAAIYGLPLVVERVSVKQGPRLSLEAEARNARYQALCGHLQVGDVLLTAHHQDDQLETVLLALTRGLGPKGLAAMGVCQPLGLDGTNSDMHGCAFQLRPFLHLSRDELKQASDCLDLVHINDESNADTRFDRNYLRLEVIPKLTARWGAIAATASRSAELCAETQGLVDDEAQQRLAPHVSRCPLSGIWRMSLAPVSGYSAPWQAQLLRQFLVLAQLAPPSKVQLQEALIQIFDAREDASVFLRFGNTCLRRFRGYLYAGAESDFGNLPAQKRVVITREQLQQGVDTPLGVLKLSARDAAAPQSGGCLHWQVSLCEHALTGELTLEYGLPGAFKGWPIGRSQRRELKKLWQEFEVPPWLRHRVPMLCCNDKLLTAAGVWLETSADSSGEDNAPTQTLTLIRARP